MQAQPAGQPPGTATESALARRAAVVLYLLILATVPLARSLSRALREAGGLRYAVISAFFIAVVAGLALARRRGVGLTRPLVLALVWSLAAQAWPQVEERVHILEYGALGLLCALGWRSTVGVALAVAGLGWLEEGVQWLVPERVYDLRDVALNATAGMAGVLIARLGLGPTGPGADSGQP